MPDERIPRAKATIATKDGKYYLVRGRQREELSPLMASEKELQALVGKEVQLATEPRRIIVGFRTPKVRVLCYIHWPRRWMCYLPRPELLHGIEEQVRHNLLDQMLKEGVIDREVAEKLR